MQQSAEPPSEPLSQPEGEGASVAKVSAEQWHVITVVVDVTNQTLVTYVDGKVSCKYDGLPAEDLKLSHQITFFGGAPQRELRGGSIKAIIIHNRRLNEEEIDTQVAKIQRKVKAHLCFYQSVPGGKSEPSFVRHVRSLGINVELVDSQEGAWEAIRGGKVDILVTQLWQPEEEDENGNMVLPGFSSSGEGKPPGLSFLEAVRKENKTVTVILDSTMPKPKSKEFIVGEKIMGNYRKGEKWYPGKIAKVHHGRKPSSSKSYAIMYDDGEYEDDVEPQDIKPQGSSKKKSASGPASKDYSRDVLRQKGSLFSLAEEAEEQICVAAVQRRSKTGR
jgi:hypothetical protein